MNFIQISEHLLKTINESQPYLEAISEQTAATPLAPDKWSRKEILGHLLDSASNNHQRFVRAALQGELSFPGYAQDALVTLQRPGDLPWSLLVRLWESYNRYLGHVIACLPESTREAPCVIGSNPSLSLEALADDYVAHLKHHLNQIMGKRFATSYGASL